jgi:hypothetical protein
VTCLRNGCTVGKPHLHVSDLEAMRYWKDQEDATLEDLLRKLRHEEPPSDRMLAGAALAKLMERGGPYADEEEVVTEGEGEVDCWRFVFALDATIEEPDGHEVEGELLFDTPNGPITLVGHCDMLSRWAVRDQKLTERFDAERYTDSLQWRAYLLMFHRHAFVYDVFEASYQHIKDPGGNVTTGRTVTLRELHQLTFYAYPDMRRDVERAVCELAAFVARHMPDRVAA